ncbi:MAG: hypothetical protein IMX01_04425 [Limnochordaceae bacterium]|nr:hypothetical protein [Limnochordaceae bacterium]
MKRLSYVLALAAVLAVAGTAAASPTINGSASLSLSGSLSTLTPNVGDLSFSWDNSFSVADGSNWYLKGSLDGDFTALSNWHLMVHPSIFEIHVANGGQYTNADLGDVWSRMGLFKLPGYSDGNHLRILFPLGSFKVEYDRGNFGQGVKVDLPKSDKLPLDLGAMTRNQVVAGYATLYPTPDITVGGEVSAPRTPSNTQDALAYGGTATVKVTPALTVIGTYKYWGTNFPSAETTGSGLDLSQHRYARLLQAVYTQPQNQYQLSAWFHQGTDKPKTDDYVSLSVVQKAGDRLDWATTDTGDGSLDSVDLYRGLKGVALYGKANLNDGWGNQSLTLALGAPIVAGKVSGKVVANLPGYYKLGSLTGVVFAQVSGKLTSETKAVYTPPPDENSSAQLSLQNRFVYTLSGSSSIVTLLEKGSNDVNYKTTFNVSF